MQITTKATRMESTSDLEEMSGGCFFLFLPLGTCSLACFFIVLLWLTCYCCLVWSCVVLYSFKVCLSVCLFRRGAVVFVAASSVSLRSFFLIPRSLAKPPKWQIPTAGFPRRCHRMTELVLPKWLYRFNLDVPVSL